MFFPGPFYFSRPYGREKVGPGVTKKKDFTRAYIIRNKHHAAFNFSRPYGREKHRGRITNCAYVKSRAI
jgi:hypothetical protein